jgi:hypothetical protein
MIEITLAYKNVSFLTDLTYNAVKDSCTGYLEVDPIDFPRPKKNILSVSGNTLRQRKYKHRKSIHTEYKFTISTDVLNDNAIYLIEQFFIADYKYISISQLNFKEVIFVDDTLEFKGIDNIIELPEITLSLIDVEPN